MSLTVTQRPEITYEGSPSRWNAVRNPVLYKMTRRDFSYNQSNNNGGFMQMQFTGVDIASSFAVGNSVYATTRGFSTVTASTFSGGNTLVTLAATYTTASSGHVNNLTTRPMYRVEVEVYNIGDVLLNDSPFHYSPSADGFLVIDISQILKAHLYPDFDAPIGSTELFDEANMYIGFYIKYREVWTGSAESQTDDVANQFYATLSGRQIPSLNGGNLAEYAIPPVSFLTKLDELVMWRGYPSLLSVIVNEDVASNVYLGTDDDSTSSSMNSGKQIAFDLNQIITDQTVEEVTAAVYEDTSGADAVSDEITVKLRDACENPIMLMGRNSLGGLMQWMFDVNQEMSYENENGVKVKRLRMFAEDLTVNQWEALNDFVTYGEVYKNNIPELTYETIKTSSRVGNQVYILSSDGTKIGVIVLPRVNVTQTKQVKHEFQIEIEYPEIL